MRLKILAAGSAAALGLIAVAGLTREAHAQRGPEQTVTPPKQVYWMSVTTHSGLMGMANMNPMDMMMGGGPNPNASNATMLLQLGSADAPARGGPQANHTVPQVARIGPQLPLRTPDRPTAERAEPGDIPQDFERPKGRLLLFFGCGERAKSGQPVVFDFARMAAGELPRGLESRIRAARVQNFNPTAWRTYGEWPHHGQGVTLFGGGQPTVLPAGASLLGEHVVRGNYTPDIRFTLTPGHDVMAPVQFTSNAKTASGAVNLAWSAIPTATGYAAVAVGGGAREDDVVFWSSSEVSTWDLGADFIPPAEAARLVRERVLMAPSTTQCTIPREVVAAMGQQQGESGGVVMFNAFGPEQNVVYPPRPADRATPWNQQWFVKARFQSNAVTMLGQDMAAMMGAGAAGAGGGAQPALSQEEVCRRREEERRAQNQGIGSAIGAATGIPGADLLGGLFGGGQKPPADPECPPRR
jgi:hypothetical protein